jgi:hypothetical protein
MQTGVSNPDQTDARSRAKRVVTKGRSRTERARFNGRTREGVRLRMLEKQFRSQLGAAAETPVMTLAIRRAAELTMLAEIERAKAIRGEPVDFDQLIRLESMVSRAVRALRLPSAREFAPPSLAEYLAATMSSPVASPAETADAQEAICAELAPDTSEAIDDDSRPSKRPSDGGGST